MGAERCPHRAVRFNSNTGRFIKARPGAERAGKAGGCDAGRLDVARHAKTAQRAALFGQAAARLECLIRAKLEDAPEKLGEIPGVVGWPDWCLVRHRRRRNEIAT